MTGTPSSLQDVQHGGRHYKGLAIQPAEYNQRNHLDFCEGEVVKYVTRHGFKGGAEDIRKAIHFCCVVLDMVYGEQTTVLYGDDALDDVKVKAPEPDEFVCREPVTLSCGEVCIPVLGSIAFDVEQDMPPAVNGLNTVDELFAVLFQRMLERMPGAIAALCNAKLGTDHNAPVHWTDIQRAMNPLHPVASAMQAMQRAAEPDKPMMSELCHAVSDGSCPWPPCPLRVTGDVCPLKKISVVRPPEPFESSGSAELFVFSSTGDAQPEKLMTHSGLKRYTGIIPGAPVKPGSIRIFQARQTDEDNMAIRDDGEGLLIGDVEPQAGLTPSTVNYTTGKIEISFAATPAADEPIICQFEAVDDNSTPGIV